MVLSGLALRRLAHWNPLKAEYRLNVQIDHRQSIGFNKVATGLNLIAHQGSKHLIRRNGVFDSHSQHASNIGVHGRVPQLAWVHFTQSFVALGADTSARFSHQPIQGFGKALNLGVTLTSLHIGTFFYQSLQHVAKTGDSTVLIGSEQFTTE